MRARREEVAVLAQHRLLLHRTLALPALVLTLNQHLCEAV